LCNIIVLKISNYETIQLEAVIIIINFLKIIKEINSVVNSRLQLKLI